MSENQSIHLSFAILFLSVFRFTAGEIHDLAVRIRFLAAKESEVCRRGTLDHLDAMLEGREIYHLPDPVSGQPELLLDRLEQGAGDDAGYAAFAARIQRDELSIGTDNPSVRARLALADLGGLLRRHSLPGEGKRLRLLSFWSAGCRPCLEEEPLLREIQTKGAMESIVVAAEATPGTRLTVLPDPNGLLFRAFGVDALPVNLLFDANGRLLGRAARLPRLN